MDTIFKVENPQAGVKPQADATCSHNQDCIILDIKHPYLGQQWLWIDTILTKLMKPQLKESRMWI